MISSCELDLRLFDDDSPITHLIASKIFDFPQPLGPIIPVTPSSIKISVECAKDLNPDIFNFLTVNNLFYFNNDSIFSFRASYVKSPSYFFAFR